MKRLNITTCPLCGSSRLEQRGCYKDSLDKQGSFSVKACGDCGFLFTADAPDESEIGRYYEQPDYISHSDTHRGIVNSLYHLARKWMLQRKVDIVLKVTHQAKGKLLDIGTGTAYFPHAMQLKGWDVSAIEKSPQARDFAREHFHINVQTEADLPQMNSESFDAITLWHSLEHMQHLHETWDCIYRLLKPNGTLVIAVPNPTSYDAAYYGEQWAAFDVPRHLWHFTPDTMQKIAAQHGFLLQELKPMPLDAFYISMLTEQQASKAFPVVRGFITGVRAYFSAQGNKKKSSSLIYMFNKANSTNHGKE